MRKSENYEMNLFDEDEFYNEEQFNENTEKIDEALKNLEDPEYNVSEQKKVEQLKSGESLKVALRKLAKAVADYISHKADEVAHITAEERTAWNAKLGAEKIAANLTTDTDGMVLAAAMGKNLQEQISILNSNNAAKRIKVFERSNSVDILNNVKLSSGAYLVSEGHAYGDQCLYLINVWEGNNFRITPILNSSKLTITGDVSTAELIIQSTAQHNLIWAIKITETF